MKHLYSNTYNLVGKNITHLQNNNYNSNNKVQFDNKINTIDFFLFDNYENIKSKKEIDHKNNNYNFFFLFIEQNGKSVQKMYNINDFIQNYCFIKIERNQKKQIGMLYPKNKIVDNINFIKNQILRDINNSIYKKDIYNNLKINNSNNLELYLINNQRNTIDNFFDIIFNIRENSSNTINNFMSDNKNPTSNDNNRNNNNEVKVMVNPNLSGNINSSNEMTTNISNIMNTSYLTNNNNSNTSSNVSSNNFNNNRYGTPNNQNNNGGNNFNYNKALNNNQNNYFNSNNNINDTNSQKNRTQNNYYNQNNNYQNFSNNVNTTNNHCQNNNNYIQNNNGSSNNNFTYSNCNNNQNNNYNQSNNNFSNNSTSTSNTTNNPNNPYNTPIPPQKYYFPKKGLYNIGSTCYMNATLQCLLHVSELVAYFLNEYKNDYLNLMKKNKYVESKGNISEAFYNLVKGVIDDEGNNNNCSNINKFNVKTSLTKSKKGSQNGFWTGLFDFGSSKSSSISTSYSPDSFKRTLGYYNSQFRRFEANDSKDLILYLLQTMHEELNYYGDVVLNRNMLRQPNQFDRVETFIYFNNTYNMRNFSIISNVFYGTYENTTICYECKNTLYNFQKFEFISFGLYDYNRKSFNIYDGFKDNQKESYLRGDNQFYCCFCKRLCDAIITCKIIQPPNKLLINLDYGKNKKYQPSRIYFDENIDITDFVNFNFGCRLKYRIIGVCTHYGYSGSTGHYIAFCRHRETGDWYKFNDSSCYKCGHNEIYGGSPYLLLYERII